MVPKRTRLRVCAVVTALLVGGVPALDVAGAAGAAPSDPANKLVWGDLYPAFPGDLMVRQPDGTSFKARLTNAEIGGRLEVGGYTIVKDAAGWWAYATTGAAGLVSSSARAGRDAPPPGVGRGIGRTRNLWEGEDGGDLRTAALRQLQIGFAKAQAQAQAAGEPVTFKFPVLMLATWWDEEKGQTSPQFQAGNDAEHFRTILDGFGGNPRGSLTEFYFENSFGQFVVQVDVYGPYVSQRSREDRCYYGGIEATPVFDGDFDPTDSSLGVGGGGAIGMAVEGVPQADPDVDFADYDNDGDGFVDFTAMLHSGPDMAATGDPCHTWSHAITAGLAGPVVEGAFGLPAGSLHHGIPTTDGVFVDRLFTMPEIDLEIGVATHEMAHALGEPDYYNPGYTSMGTGDWDIMAGGSWFGNPPGSNPTGFNPASRVFQGWMTPMVIYDDTRSLTLGPRELVPTPGYVGSQTNPNVALVPTQWINVGQTDIYGHTWNADDVYGLVRDGDRGYVIEGYYLENWSRTVNAAPIHPEMTRAPYFDRQALGSGIMVWHWDYYLRSNVYFGGNNAGSDPNRPQMDPVEFDRNDNTQELQLALTRGDPGDLLWGAATGITSGTRLLPPLPDIEGSPQSDEAWTGFVAPFVGEDDHAFEVKEDAGNFLMTVSVVGRGDCTLSLFGPDGQIGGTADSGFIGDRETIEVQQPKPGDYIARTGDFAACTDYEGSIDFSSPTEIFHTKGAGDTWSNWTQAPTGWAFTNVGPAESGALDNAADAPGPEAITLDVINVGDDEVDVSPGFVRGSTPVNAGSDSAMTVPVFNNGGTSLSGVEVEVRDSNRLVASGLVDLAPYSRTELAFAYRPANEGPYSLLVTVDPAGALVEVHEGNNAQGTDGWAGPPDPRVLIVDDDGANDSERLYAGALASLGIPYAIAAEHVDAATMGQFEAVVWEAGLERYQGQMDADDRAAVKEYLAAGGKMLYTSPRAAAALGEEPSRTNPLATDDMPEFLRDHFGVSYVDTLQVGGGLVTGLGDILGTSSYGTDVFPGRPLQDVFTAAGAETGLVTDVASWEKGGAGALMGVRLDADAEHGGFQTVFLGFNLSQLTETDDVIAVVDGVMGHFGVSRGGYEPAKVRPLVYHAQVRNRVSGVAAPVKAIVLGDARMKGVTLSFRRHGQGGYYSVSMTRGDRAGSFLAEIPANAVTPDGVDYYIKAGAGRRAAFDPPRAPGGTLVHGIAVARPEVASPIPVR